MLVERLILPKEAIIILKIIAELSLVAAVDRRVFGPIDLITNEPLNVLRQRSKELTKLIALR